MGSRSARKRVSLRSLAPLATVCAFGPALAEEIDAPADSARYAIPEVVVEAPRPDATVGGSAIAEVRVDSLETPAAASVRDVFERLPLLHVRTNSRGEAEISARGSESRQVAVLVDGVPITLAWDARADVSVIPATSLREVRFVRGLSSMLYGPNVLGGIVDARVGQTFDQPERPTLELHVGADDVGTVGTTITTAIPVQRERGNWLLRGGVGFRDTPGDPLADGISEPVATDRSLRLNTDAQNVDGFGAARYQTTAGRWVSFSASSFAEERGIAAELGVDDADARLWRNPHVARTLAVLSAGTAYGASPFGGQGDLEASIGFDRSRVEIDEFASRAYDEVTGFEDGDDRTLTLRLLADQTVGERNDLRTAFTFADIHHDESIPDGDFEYRQRVVSVGVEDVWRPVRSGRRIQSVAVTAGGAYDAASTPETGGREALGTLSEWGGRLGVSATMREGGVIVHAGVSRRGRFPALRELYSGALDRFAPNPDLKPEKLLTTEAGVTTRFRSGEVQLVGFHNRLRDAVVRITLEDRRFMRVNRDELQSTGVELLGYAALGPVDLYASGVAQNVELTDTSAEETHAPENLPELYGEASASLRLFRGFVGSLGVEFIGEQFAIDPGTGEDTELAAEAIVSSSISRRWPLYLSWGPGAFSVLETRIAVDNLGDVAHFDAAGLPAPGRRVRFELRFR